MMRAPRTRSSRSRRLEWSLVGRCSGRLPCNQIWRIYDCYVLTLRDPKGLPIPPPFVTVTIYEVVQFFEDAKLVGELGQATGGSPPAGRTLVHEAMRREKLQCVPHRGSGKTSGFYDVEALQAVAAVLQGFVDERGGSAKFVEHGTEGM